MFDNAFIFDQPPQPQAHPLLQPNHTICPAYHHPNRLDHEERYLGWHPHHHARHNGIVALLRSTLQALINGIVTLKPRTQEGQHRNDVYPPHQQGARTTTANRREPGPSLFDLARRECLVSLQIRQPVLHDNPLAHRRDIQTPGSLQPWSVERENRGGNQPLRERAGEEMCRAA
ncbi:hypothetical protein C365_02813 [Cryptococcus neoformans Bt85]|nr:hypothetical protein C365_02838 [Cryptococcus neoformans var. grubii Bt85]OWZ78639.1 hypothetical protein C365_02836 [Cryptococcus neoformans var. grubii Bt85]OWZ78699.1 hypothetical protein C365_02813 [Cryptococcus neoformans var. grubii Bt85]OXM79144.1 hypothetical protein C364_02635 [Cryptococcus neoformans var. grubii Bt63]